MQDRNYSLRARRIVVTGVFSVGIAAPLFAAAGEHNLGLPAGTGKAVYTAECGSCHIAYPPQLLSASGWNLVIAGLDRHFGVDASVDTKAAQAVGNYLAANAGSERRFGANTLRISDTPWFRKEHDEVPAGAWKAPQTRSAANCAACHPGADRSDFSERAVRLPAAARR
jgi:mono/diheme cytochrome c family protein